MTRQTQSVSAALLLGLALTVPVDAEPITETVGFEPDGFDLDAGALDDIQPASVSPAGLNGPLTAARSVTTLVENRGQIADGAVRFYTHGGSGPRFTTDGVHLVGREGSVSLRFVGANPEAVPRGADPAEGRVNILRGRDPADWRTGIPTYHAVVYRELWPGIDASFRNDAGKLKYEFTVGPGVGVESIRLAYEGVQGLSIGADGCLRVETAAGVLTDDRPVAYQQLAGQRVSTLR